MAVDVNITGLSDTGTELGGFMSNIAPGIGTFLITVGVAVGIAGLIAGVIYMIKKTATRIQ